MCLSAKKQRGYNAKKIQDEETQASIDDNARAWGNRKAPVGVVLYHVWAEKFMTDYKEVNQRLLTQNIYRQWFPAGKTKAHEYVVGDLSGKPGESLSINHDTGVWKDFATGDTGPDLISLYAAIHKIPNSKALVELSDQREDGAQRVFPKEPPSVFPAHPLIKYMVDSYIYQELDGRIKGIILRCEPPDGRKQFPCLTCWEKDGKRTWQYRGMGGNRPLYNYIDDNSPVLIVEGEKKCKRAQQLLPEFNVVAWSGGASAVKQTNWNILQGRTCYIWPDNNEPGHKAAAEIAKITGAKIVKLPDDTPQDWDLGDAGDDYDPASVIYAKALKSIKASSWQGKEVEKQEWIVQDMVPAQTTTALSGDGGLGKSLLAMQMMTQVSTGGIFLTKDTMKGPALGLFCEDREGEIHRRQIAINQHYSLGFKDLENLHYLPRVGNDNSLVNVTKDKIEKTQFFDEFRELALDLHAKLIVIDTAADTFMGNENIRTQVRYYVQLLNGLANDTGGAVVLLVHPSLSGLQNGSGTSGSTAWNNSVRSRWYLEKPKANEGEDVDPNLRLLTQKKSNYSAVDNLGQELRWEDGIFRQSLDQSHAIMRMKQTEIRHSIQKAMEHLHKQNINLSVSPKSSNYGPKELKNKIGGKYSYKEIDIVFNQMIDDFSIVNVPYGPPSRCYYRAMLAVNLAGDLEDTEE